MTTQLVDREVFTGRFAVGTVGDHRLERIGDVDDSRLERDLLAAEPVPKRPRRVAADETTRSIENAGDLVA
jgi:hypothetical protein